MIKDLVSGKEASALVVIKDCLPARGENLLLCWSRQLSQRVDVLVSLHCGTTEKLGCETLDIDCLNGLQCDANPPSLDSSLARLKSHHSLAAEESTSSSSPSVSFVLPDLNSLFLFYPSSSVFSFLHSLLRLRPQTTVIGLLHRDCFPVALLPSLDYLTRTSITLHPAPNKLLAAFRSSSSSSSLDDPLSTLADVFHKKPSGKVIRSRELVIVAPSPPRVLNAVDVTSLSVKDDTPEVDAVTTSALKTPSNAKVSASKSTTPQIAYEDPSTSSDPTANLTFNLNLSDREKSARDKVVLPFAKKQAGQGKIIYEAEDEDDLDEEDPDDDLNV